MWRQSRILNIFVVTVFVLDVEVVSRSVASLFSDLFPTLALDHSWILLFIYTTVQMCSAIFIIKIVLRGKLKNYGFRTDKLHESFRSVLRAIVFLAPILIISWYTAYVANIRPFLEISLTAPNVIGMLCLRWIYIGLAEEIYFRGLLQTLLGTMWDNGSIPKSILIASAVSGLLHLSLYPIPMGAKVNLLESFYSFGLGILFGYIYWKTKSLLGSILIHNIVEGTLLTGNMVLVMLAGGK